MLGNEAEAAADAVAMRQVVDLQRRAGGWSFLMYLLPLLAPPHCLLPGRIRSHTILQADSPDALAPEGTTPTAAATPRRSGGPSPATCGSTAVRSHVGCSPP